MKKPTIIALILIVLIGAAGASIYVLKDNQNIQTPVTQQQVTETSKPTITFSEDGKTANYDGVEGQDALTTLKSLTEVVTTDTSFGDMAVGINNVVANQDEEYWAFYVNGQMASVGAGAYTAKAGDKLEWRLEKL